MSGRFQCVLTRLQAECATFSGSILRLGAARVYFPLPLIEVRLCVNIPTCQRSYPSVLSMTGEQRTSIWRDLDFILPCILPEFFVQSKLDERETLKQEKAY
jgi:hypothetical protein